MTAYPHAPGARAVDTSQAAALAIGPVTAPLQQKVLDALGIEVRRHLLGEAD